MNEENLRALQATMPIYTVLLAIRGAIIAVKSYDVPTLDVDESGRIRSAKWRPVTDPKNAGDRVAAVHVDWHSVDAVFVQLGLR